MNANFVQFIELAEPFGVHLAPIEFDLIRMMSLALSGLRSRVFQFTISWSWMVIAPSIVFPSPTAASEGSISDFDESF